MKRSICVMGFVIIALSIAFSGCQEDNNNSDKKYEGVYLESDVVELAYANLEFITKFNPESERDIVETVELEYRFHNIAGRDININVTVKYYNKDDTLLETIAGKQTNNLFKDYTEKMINNITYNGDKVTQVDHVIIIAEEV